jgi:hypothetical protein
MVENISYERRILYKLFVCYLFKIWKSKHSYLFAFHLTIRQEGHLYRLPDSNTSYNIITNKNVCGI